MKCLSTILSLGVTTMLTAAPLSPFPQGEPNVAYANFFTGQSHLARLTTHHAEHGVPIANVTFAPGCRNHWHRHTQGQILIAVGGEGLYQARGEAARRLRPGDVVEIPPQVDHWHGATARHAFAHLAIEVRPDQNRTTWLEPVSDADYAAAQPSIPLPPQLTPRQGALAQLSAATALGNMAQLAEVAEAGFACGLTLNEMKEAILHVQAYVGFPRCLNGYAALAGVCERRQAAGLPLPEGTAPRALPPGTDRERLGRETRARLAGTAPDAPLAAWQRFAPGAEQFLKEHLFCDLFARGVLTEAERELCTFSALSVMTGVVPQWAAHRQMALRCGLAEDALGALEQWLNELFVIPTQEK